MNEHEFSGKSILILGLARQGLALARFFVKAGAQVTVSDAATAEKLAEELGALGDLPVTLALGGHPLSLLDGCDLLCLSGGVPAQLPIVQTAIERGIPLSNDSLLTLQMAPCPVIAITGSSGKTTTTTLVGEMLRESFADTDRTVHVGGNIGTPLLDRLDQVRPTDIMVLELSSFQLELWDQALAYGSLDNLGPDIAAILNITPNHLDRHPSMRAYADAKFNLLRYVKADSRVVLNGEWRMANGDRELNALLADTAAHLATRNSAPLLFSREEVLATGAWLDGDRLLFNGKEICRRDQVKLRGDHNVSNLLAAALISGAAGATVSAMTKVATSFAGVPHRLEVVAEIGGVTWINDSIATAPERAVAGLRCFRPGAQTLILLAGGKDKKLPWTPFADEVLARVSFLIGFGHAGPMIVDVVQERMTLNRLSAPTCAVVNRLDEAVALAARIAGPGSVVLLSPGGTSYDAYKNFEQRGEHFRRLVMEN
ncbi:MAG: UDP-N-acetylmuramoyl-L-alanine--D-glutamate ligase [Caldilineaceae bacterium]|nr:UDP-N-acetylmuramoyl-L-alanine--D-glutamate ligase [Caldilineaceae bacterium]